MTFGIDDGNLRLCTREEEIAGLAALRAALEENGHRPTADELATWSTRLRPAGDGYVATFATKLPNGNPVLGVAPLDVVAKRLPHESEFEREALEKLEGAAALVRTMRARNEAVEAQRSELAETQDRLERWFRRGILERAMLVVAAEMPEHKALLHAIVRAIAAQPVSPKKNQYGAITDRLPPNDADLIK
jgi:hypothetical protein